MKRKELKSLTLQKNTISIFELNASKGAGITVTTAKCLVSQVVLCTIPIGVTAHTCVCDPNNTAA